MPGDKGAVRVASIYAPNGNPVGTEKFAYKLAGSSGWRRMRAACSRSRSRWR